MIEDSTQTDSTRAALIDAAEAVFARDGFERASLRAIMRLADANPAAVHYHFGGKDGLVEAVLDRIVGPISLRRLELLDRLQTVVGPDPTTRDLMEAFLRPDFEAIQTLQRRGSGRAALLARAYGQPTEHIDALIRRQFEPVGAHFLRSLNRALPHLSTEQLQWRLRWCVVGVIIAMFSYADRPDGPIDVDDFEPALERTVDFVTAGMETD